MVGKGRALDFRLRDLLHSLINATPNPKHIYQSSTTPPKWVATST
jgi:hypothetical protein